MLDPNEWITIAVSFAGGGGLIGVANLLANRKKSTAETELTEANKEAVLSGAALAFVKELRTDVSDLRAQATHQIFRARELGEKVQILEDHIKIQVQIIFKLRTALSGYNPEHPLLKERPPDLIP